MTKPLYISETLISPKVELNPEDGIFLIRGKLLTTTPESFFKPVLNWLSDYIPMDQEKIEFHFDISCSDVNCAKRVLFVLYKLRNLMEAGHMVRVHWHYHFYNYGMREIGEDFANIISDIPFHFAERKVA